MLVVNDLDETLNPRFLRRLLGRVLADDLARVLLESGYEAVSVRTLAVAVVEGTDDDSLLTSITALKEDHSFVLLQKLNHGFVSTFFRRGLVCYENIYSVVWKTLKVEMKGFSLGPYIVGWAY